MLLILVLLFLLTLATGAHSPIRDTAFRDSAGNPSLYVRIAGTEIDADLLGVLGQDESDALVSDTLVSLSVELDSRLS